MISSENGKIVLFFSNEISAEGHIVKHELGKKVKLVLTGPYIFTISLKILIITERARSQMQMTETVSL